MAISLQPIQRERDKPAPAAPVIHIIDDDSAFRAAIADLLHACGYRVELNDSAAKLMKQVPIDEAACILVDLGMPGCGPQLQERLATLGSKAPIIFVTGYGDIPTAVSTIKAGAEDFLIRPVPKARLLDPLNARSRIVRKCASRQVGQKLCGRA